MKQLLVIIFIISCYTTKAQISYTDSLKLFQQEYVANHEVVKGADKKLIQFFPVDIKNRVTARFEAIKDASWFNLPTSSGRTKLYRQYGKLLFELDGKQQVLYIYQSQALLQNPQYASSLFLPFTDATTGKESYETGRYIDLDLADIKGSNVIIDFNKAYNPYCAYVSGYSCPIPPKENRLSISVKAGEKKYLKEH